MEPKEGTGENPGGVGIESRREFVRADDNISVYYEACSESASPEDRNRFESIFNDIEPGPEENPKLYELLFDISQKLNLLVTQMSDKGVLKIPEASEVNISGGGIRFQCTDGFAEGDMLMLKTFLPTHGGIVNMKCRVLRIEDIGGGVYKVAAEFEDMDEATREKIIRFIFSKQRRRLRSERALDTKS
jgi:hypothetical protein